MQSKKVHILMFLCIAAIGCYATIAQVILIREFMNVFYGNELCLGIVFGAWFLGIAIGAFVGAKIEHNFKHTASVFIVTLIIMCFVLPFQIVSVRGIRSLLNVGVGEYISILPLIFASIGLIVPFSFIIGFIFPFSSKVIRGATTGGAVDIGLVYIVESIGSLFGGLVFSFYMVLRFHPFEVIILLNITMLFLLTVLQFPFLRKEEVCFSEEGNKTAKGWLGFVSLGLLAIMIAMWFSSIPGRVEASSAKMRWNTLNPKIELITSTDSKYQHIDLGRQAEQFSIYLNGQYAAAFPNEYEYAQIAHLVMTQHPSPKHVLLIGCGLGGLISEMLLYPIEILDYVELDQNLLHTAEKYLSSSDKQALNDRRVTVFHQDGRYYVKNVSEKKHYDIILVNTPDPSTAFLNRFYTLEFFKEAQAILKTDGVMATSVSSSVTYIGKEVGSYTGSLYRTLHEAFQNVVVTPGQTNLYFACNSNGIITLDIETLMERYKEWQISSDYFTEHLFYTLLQPEQVNFIERQLSQRKDLLVNTDAKPVTYFLNLVLWDSLTGGHFHGLFHSLKDTGLQSFLIPIVIALAGRIIYVILRQSRRFDFYYAIQLKATCLIALATTGFAGIAFEIVTLYAFQNIYGYIYERMGIIVAVFMVGLALGGYIANRIIHKGWHGQTCLSVHNSAMREKIQSPTEFGQSKWINILMIFEGIIGLYAIILPFIIRTLSFYSTLAEFGLIFLIGVGGVLTGIEFPLVNKIFMQCNNNIVISAGVTDSADHIGAFLGAILTGVIFLPLLGLFGTCLILATLNISSLILIAIFKMQIPDLK